MTFPSVVSSRNAFHSLSSFDFKDLLFLNIILVQGTRLIKKHLNGSVSKIKTSFEPELTVTYRLRYKTLQFIALPTELFKAQYISDPVQKICLFCMNTNKDNLGKLDPEIKVYIVCHSQPFPLTEREIPPKKICNLNTQSRHTKLQIQE